MIEPYIPDWQRVLAEPAIRPIDDVDRAKWRGQEKHMTWDRESNEEYDDGFTRESFERAEEDTPETCAEPEDTHLYRVAWCIDIEAVSPEAAAREALRIQRDPESTATVFEIVERRDDGEEAGPWWAQTQTADVIDLTEIDERRAGEHVCVTPDG